MQEENPSDTQSKDTALERILEGIPAETRLKILEIVKKHGINNEDDVVFQVTEILGIYAEYFETIPSRFRECIEEKLGRLEIIATHIQKTSGEDYEQLKEEGVALITSLQEFVILTQSVKEETHAALQKTSTHLQELSESFSKEIKEQIVSKVLDELVDKVKETLDKSEEALNQALATNRHAAEEISTTTTNLVEASRTQLQDAHDLSVDRVRKRYAALSFLWGTGIAVLFSIGAWLLLEARMNTAIVTAEEAWRFDRQAAWDAYVAEMADNKDVLKRLADGQIQLRFLRQGSKNYLVVPGGTSHDTEIGAYIEVPFNVESPKLD